MYRDEMQVNLELRMMNPNSLVKIHQSNSFSKLHQSDSLVNLNLLRLVRIICRKILQYCFNIKNKP